MSGKIVLLRVQVFIMICLIGVTGCGAGPIEKSPGADSEARVNELLSRMTLEEKIGQMTLADRNSLLLTDITDLFIGGILSAGGGYPYPNTPEEWAKMTDQYQDFARKSRLGIPLIYGADAVHGHNNLKGAVIFPHNVGLGAAHDPALMERVGRITAREMCATGVLWDFAPVVAVPQDIRWGRTYEGYGENPELVSVLGAAYIKGLQNTETAGMGAPGTVLATPKHFIGDGGTEWGVAVKGRIDQGDVRVDEAVLRKVHLPPYRAALDAGALCTMVSYSSWKDLKMHAHKYLLTDVLKGELGFQGFLVSDYQGIQQIPGNDYSDVVTSINAGLDMIMVSQYYQQFIKTFLEAARNGDIPIERIDDAVRRILRVKMKLRLFERNKAERALLPAIGSAEHRAVAREAVRKSLVLLKNDHLLPLAKDLPVVCVAGKAADDIGIQCGGWTIEWQGKAGAITDGTTILAGIKAALGKESQLFYDNKGEFGGVPAKGTTGKKADVGIVVAGERPYAEGAGDEQNLTLSRRDRELIARVRPQCDRLLLVVVSGRPLVVTDVIAKCDAVVAVWLPGTEGQGVADVLFGDFPFTGKLSYTWPKSLDRIPVHTDKAGAKDVLFPYGFGLSYK